MKIVVIGGTGLIGSQVVQKLILASHEAVRAARSTGVDLITGAGLDRVLAGADIVVNLTNSPTFDDASLDFFRHSTTNLLEAGAIRLHGTAASLQDDDLIRRSYLGI